MNDVAAGLVSGLFKELDFTVEAEHTAAHLGSGTLAVLSTPSMILFMEIAARTLLDEHLPQGFSSVGTRVDVRHRAAAPLGAVVRARAEIVQRDGNTIFLRVACQQGDRLLGDGQHERFVIDVARFLKRAG